MVYACVCKKRQEYEGCLNSVKMQRTLISFHFQPPFASITITNTTDIFTEINTETKMERREDGVHLGTHRFRDRRPLGTAARIYDKDYKEPEAVPFFEAAELCCWSFYRAAIAEFVATFLFLYISLMTVIQVSKSQNKCSSVGVQGIAWAFGGMIFALVYCTSGISGQLP